MGTEIFRNETKGYSEKSILIMKNKTLLIFDVYGTIISTGNGSINAVESILSLQDKSVNSDLFYAEWKKFHRENMNNANINTFLSEEKIFENDLKLLYEKYNIKKDYSDDVSIMLSSLIGRKCFEDTKSTIDELRKNYRVVLGSTTDTEPLMENLRLNELSVDAVYTSEIIEKYKPDIEFYKYILKSENCNAENAVFIGDSLIDDIFGPKQLEIKTVLIDRNNKYNLENQSIKPDFVIHNLTELLALNL
ncbi:MAG: HAD family hydrolase [Eubacterium sp.]|nr:HAD family hydrolase [Eubacterium sp.]